MIQGQGGNVAVSSGTDGVFLVDDQVEPITEELLAEIRRIGDGPIRFVINTHFHADHMGGNEAIGKSGAVIIAHDNVRQRLQTEQFNQFLNKNMEAAPAGALPVVTFSETVTLHFNGETATAHHVPRGHTDGDAILHFPESKVIHMGDIYFNGLYPFIDLDSGGSVQGMIAAVELALSLADEETRIIPGHGPVATRAELVNYRDFLVQATERVQALVDQGKTLQQVIDAKPTAQWDESLGKIWITPAQMVTVIYNSLRGIGQFTRIEGNSSG